MTPGTPPVAPCGFVQTRWLLARSTRTQHPTPIHLSVLPHGGCGPTPRRKRDSPAILATAPNGWAGLHSTSTTSFAGIILADFQTLQLGGHAIAHRSGAEPGGTDSALDLCLSKLTALAVLRRSSYLVLSGGLKIGLVERSPHRAPAARARRRAGVGARREDRLNPLNRHLNERACLGRPAWLQPV